MKVRSSIKAMCKHCYVVRRGKTRFVYCKETAKHKQRQGYHTMSNQYGSNFCCMCNLANDVPALLSTANYSALPIVASSGNISTLTAMFSSKFSLENLSNTQTTTLKTRYIPEVGIYSILKA